MYNELFNELEKIVLPKVLENGNSNRYGFPTHRRTTFGYVRERFSGKYNISLYSRKHPNIYKMLMDIGNEICDHPFTSIHIVKNLVCPPHKDKNNVGVSTIVSFGDYTGGRLIIEGEEHDAYEKPIQFNGYEKLHSNTNDLVGTKYSAIFYSIQLPF